MALTSNFRKLQSEEVFKACQRYGSLSLSSAVGGAAGAGRHGACNGAGRMRHGQARVLPTPLLPLLIQGCCFLLLLHWVLPACRAGKRLFLLDHDGTLVAQSSITSKPSQEVLT